MTEAAKKITQIGTPEQDFEQKEPEKPWLRQKGEPAKLYLWFKRYLDLGPKRSLRKALAAEPVEQKASKGPGKEQETNKLSDISIPGAWKRAAKVWQWQERAHAYDLAEQAIQAGYLRESANKSRFASKPYRIFTLDWMARALKEEIQKEATLADRHAAMCRLQSIMRDMAKEMEGVDEATLQACDAAALEAIKQELTEGKQKK